MLVSLCFCCFGCFVVVCVFGTLVARAIRNAVRANRFARIIRNWNPYFYSASSRFAWIARISNSRESPDSRESCESRFARITPLSLVQLQMCSNVWFSCIFRLSGWLCFSVLGLEGFGLGGPFPFFVFCSGRGHLTWPSTFLFYFCVLFVLFFVLFFMWVGFCLLVWFLFVNQNTVFLAIWLGGCNVCKTCH